MPKNAFHGWCEDCEDIVPAGHGRVHRVRRSWVIRCRGEIGRAAETASQRTYYLRRIGDGRFAIGVVQEPDGVTRALDFRYDLERFGDGLNWGADTPQARQLALAILADLFGDACARAGTEQFAKDVIIPQAADAWTITETELWAWLDDLPKRPMGLGRADLRAAADAIQHARRSAPTTGAARSAASSGTTSPDR